MFSPVGPHGGVSLLLLSLRRKKKSARHICKSYCLCLSHPSFTVNLVVFTLYLLPLRDFQGDSDRRLRCLKSFFIRKTQDRCCGFLKKKTLRETGTSFLLRKICSHPLVPLDGGLEFPAESKAIAALSAFGL